MKFTRYRNLKTLVDYYLDDISTIDGVATFLRLEKRRDLTKDFRSTSIGRNPNLQQSLLAKTLDKLKYRQDFLSLKERIEMLGSQINTTIIEDARRELKAKRR